MQDSADILESIKDRYGKDLFRLVENLTEYNVSSRKSLQELQEYLDNFLDTDNKYEGGGKGIGKEDDNNKEENKSKQNILFKILVWFFFKAVFI